MSVDCEIRAMRAEELVTVARLFHECWHETQAPLQHPAKASLRDLAFFEQRLKKRASIAVASHGDLLVGFVSWVESSLNSLFVDKAFRNRSFGYILLRHAESAMFANGATQIELDCVVGNHAARRFYERHGWHLHRIESDQREIAGDMIATDSWMMVKP